MRHIIYKGYKQVTRYLRVPFFRCLNTTTAKIIHCRFFNQKTSCYILLTMQEENAVNHRKSMQIPDMPRQAPLSSNKGCNLENLEILQSFISPHQYYFFSPNKCQFATARTDTTLRVGNFHQTPACYQVAGWDITFMHVRH